MALTGKPTGPAIGAMRELYSVEALQGAWSRPQSPADSPGGKGYSEPHVSLTESGACALMPVPPQGAAMMPRMTSRSAPVRPSTTLLAEYQHVAEKPGSVLGPAADQAICGGSAKSSSGPSLDVAAAAT
jgi:hypothetical protein